MEDLLEDLLRAQKKKDGGTAVCAVLDKMADGTTQFKPKHVYEFILDEGGKAGKIVKKLRGHENSSVRQKAVLLIKDWKEIVQKETERKEKAKPKIIRLMINDELKTVKAESGNDKVKCPVPGCPWKGFPDKLEDHVKKSRINGCRKHGATALSDSNLSALDAANQMYGDMGRQGELTTKGEAGDVGED
mmetsp:Transcript_36350/g.74587  ORF Transcript_36350/g.74587 Transcript_36350/m.74587 type:complete len:189 (+) Transcript_36350:294-860(+)|eukprot:CAMPEP_0181316070 /NCGR_PEP_ID=MMETSP1101-20121128/15701_1 /TAXON_ID=46948 /ORGANISM="Rhodomonas abbreviata, Strain Caron Lab Isolate" /LENGTH=188 /DNA_ID=CAMNT_0023423297 /DNA_START=329 /DNA_END=895 /DNA_ORIENTATION=-